MAIECKELLCKTLKIHLIHERFEKIGYTQTQTTNNGSALTAPCFCVYIKQNFKVSLNRHFNTSHSFIPFFSILHGLRGPIKPRIPNVYWDFAIARQVLNSCCDITRMRPCLWSQSRAWAWRDTGPRLRLFPDPGAGVRPQSASASSSAIWRRGQCLYRKYECDFVVMFGYIIFCASGNPDVYSHVFWH